MYDYFFVYKLLMFLDTWDQSAAQENKNKCSAACLNWKKFEPKSQEFNQEHLWLIEDAEQSLDPRPTSGRIYIGLFQDLCSCVMWT
jgi:hypothetical protein